MAPRPLRILALDPYHGGSHRQFVDGLKRHSSHDVDIVGLPPRHFKWRLRSAAVGFARLLREAKPITPDLLWTTSLQNACELRGLLPLALCRLPLVVYFHEHQIDYPSRADDPRDVHFAISNWLSALSASEVWFNSGFCQTSFLEGMERILRKMPDERELASLDRIRKKSVVLPPGVPACLGRDQRSGPLHLVWVSRWEHDKNPEDFSRALDELARLGRPFKVSLLGQRFKELPTALREIEQRHQNSILFSGYAERQDDYRRILSQADAVVSTAHHEFFGVAVMEAVREGCIPVVPHRQVYPELYPPECLYGEHSSDLSRRLCQLAELKASAGTLRGYYDGLGLAKRTAAHTWSRRIGDFDAAFLRVFDRAQGDPRQPLSSW